MSIRTDISIDWGASPRLLTIAAPSTEVTVQDIVDTCREFEDTFPNMNRPKLIDAAGKEFLGGVTYVGITATFQNAVIAFEARGGPDWILCSIAGGNIVAIDVAGANIDPRYPTAFVTVDRTASASATLQEQGAIQYSSFGGGITIDIVHGTAGTAYPIGTKETPVDNLPDAVTIANSRGFDTLYVNESMTFNGGTDIKNFSVIGRSRVTTVITMDPTALCDGIGIENCTITGTLDGNIRIRNCNVGDLLYVYGHIMDSSLYGTVTLAGNQDAYISNCSLIDVNNVPIIDMGGSGQDIFLADWSGGIKFRNMNGANKIGIQIDGGRVYLEATISAGFVGLAGTGELFDSSTGTAVVSTSGLMSKDTIAEAVSDEIGAEIQYASYNNMVAIDVAHGVAGTDYNIGTLANPVNNIPDALTIAAARGFETFHIHGNLTIAAGHTVDGFLFEGHSSIKNTVTVEAASSTVNCEFKDCAITGTLDGGTLLQWCQINTLAYVNGEIRNCRLAGPITLGGGANAKFIDCGTVNPGMPCQVDMGGTGQSCMFHDYSGGLKFINLSDAAQQIRVQYDGGKMVLDPTISAGYVIAIGIGLITDNSTGTCDVNTDGLLNNDMAKTAAYGKEVMLDTVNGIAGTAYPVGTRAYPSNNLTDTLAICTARNLIRIMARSSVTIGASHNIDGISIETHGILGTDIIFQAGCSAHKATIRYANVSGVITPGDELFIESCSVGALTDFTGIMNLTTLGQGSEITLGTWALFIDSHCGGEPTNEPEINIGTGSLSIAGYFGNLKLTGKTGANRTVATFTAGNVSIASTCVAGKIQILGIGEVEKDDSGPGCQVDVDAALTNDYIAEHVRTLMETTGSELDDLFKLQGLDTANSMTVTPTSRAVGTISQTITGDGIATSTVQRT